MTPTIRMYCPECGEETPTRTLTIERRIKVRREEFVVQEELQECTICGTRHSVMDADGPLTKAVAEYRRRHGLLFPEEIRALREKRGLTQKELAAILGLGAVTLSRYENGALQDESHDRQLRVAMDDEGFAAQLRATPEGALERDRISLLFLALKASGGRKEASMSFSPAGTVSAQEKVTVDPLLGDALAA